MISKWRGMDPDPLHVPDSFLYKPGLRSENKACSLSSQSLMMATFSRQKKMTCTKVVVVHTTKWWWTSMTRVSKKISSLFFCRRVLGCKIAPQILKFNANFSLSNLLFLLYSERRLQDVQEYTNGEGAIPNTPHNSRINNMNKLCSMTCKWNSKFMYLLLLYWKIKRVRYQSVSTCFLHYNLKMERDPSPLKNGLIEGGVTPRNEIAVWTQAT